MRIKKQIESIDYTETRGFFQRRAGRYKEENPYSVTMYQDNDLQLVKKRHEREIERLYPLLNINSQSKVLDIACGIGRWADVMPDIIEEYCGIDFSEELIAMARQRNMRSQFSFLIGAADQVESVLCTHQKGKFNTILLVSIMMYLNDEDIEKMLQQISKVSEMHTILCVREPVGLGERLTLKNFYSEDLKDNYNAIYRERCELEDFFQRTIIKQGFVLRHEGFVFDEESLNNRKETEQYYYIFER